jgi:hypothetical protein
LFSVRERLELLGGSMHIDSAPGRGTRVTLLAPLEHGRAVRVVTAAGRRRSAPTARVRKRSDRVRVLVADDHKVMGLPKLRGIGDNGSSGKECRRRS